jgi:glutamate N-acetyltransferase / amino-acid N-acetyltransferase
VSFIPDLCKELINLRPLFAIVAYRLLLAVVMALHISQVKQVARFLPRTCTRFYSVPGEGAVPPSKQKYIPKSGTYPLGFLASSVHVGVKPSNTRFDDLALIVSELPAAAAAVFTKNKFQAAPVTVSRSTINKRQGEGIRAIVVNSGCANAVTGIGGIRDAEQMGKVTDKCVDGNREDSGQSTSIVMSTGVIGQRCVLTSLFVWKFVF